MFSIYYSVGYRFVQDADVHFLVGGTQTNLAVIAAALRPHQGVIGAQSAHINVHETGAIEAFKKSGRKSTVFVISSAWMKGIVR